MKLGKPHLQEVCTAGFSPPRRDGSIRDFLADHVAFHEDEDEVRDLTLRILDEFESIARRPEELCVGQRNQRRTLEEQLPSHHRDRPY